MQKDFIYENYLKMPDDLEFEQAMKVYEELLEENLEEDEIYDKLWDHALHCMIDYGSLRAHWKITPKTDRSNDDRTVMHDSVIHSLDELAAYTKSMAKKQNGEMNLDIKEKNRRFCMLCFFDLWSICKVKYDESVKSKFCQIKRSVRRTL